MIDSILRRVLGGNAPKTMHVIVHCPTTSGIRVLNENPVQCTYYHLSDEGGVGVGSTCWASPPW